MEQLNNVARGVRNTCIGKTGADPGDPQRYAFLLLFFLLYSICLLRILI